MKNTGISLLEPIMRVEITVPESYLSAIMKDLPRRRAEIKHVDAHRQNKVTCSSAFVLCSLNEADALNINK